LLGNLILTQISISLPALVQRVTKVDALIMKGEIHRLLTSPFFHNSFQHFGSSAYTIYNFGARVRFLVFFCMCNIPL
jgi:membrane associated rhomboid family serine protease